MCTPLRTWLTSFRSRYLPLSSTLCGIAS
jgi:hypothetical protein